MPDIVAESRVAIFVDFENMRKSLVENFDSPPAPRQLADAIIELAKEQGRVVMAIAYADWTLNKDGAKAATRCGIRSPPGPAKTDRQ